MPDLFNYFSILPLFSDWSLLVLRVAAGVILIGHGKMKFKNISTAAQRFGSGGFRPGWFWARAVMILELAGGLAIILGIYVQLFAALFAIQFAIILVWRIIRRAAFAGGVDLDLDLMLFSVSLVLATMGGGVFTLGGLLGY